MLKNARMISLVSEERVRRKMKKLCLTLLVWICLALAFGCNSRSARVIKPDGTVIEVDLRDFLSDKEIGALDITYDPVRGVYGMNLAKYGSETSPLFSDIALAIFEAGRRAGMAAP